MDKKYILGISRIDAQHEAITKAVDAIRKAISRKDDQHLVHEALKKLQRTLANHFSHEESLMEMINYRELSQHKRMHKGLLGHFDEYFNQAPNASDYEYFGMQLIDQVLAHVMEHDSWMTDWVRHHQRLKHHGE